MDASLLFKITQIKNEITKLCASLRTTYNTYKTKMDVETNESIGQYASLLSSNSENATIAQQGIIKSVQRGIIEAGATAATIDASAVIGTTYREVSVDISPVETGKAIVFCDENYYSTTKGLRSSFLNTKIAYSGDTCTLYIYFCDNAISTLPAIQWQVIEFY